MKKILSILCLLLLLIPYTAATAEQKYYIIGQLHDLIEEEYPNGWQESIKLSGHSSSGIRAIESK